MGWPRLPRSRRCAAVHSVGLLGSGREKAGLCGSLGVGFSCLVASQGQDLRIQPGYSVLHALELGLVHSLFAI